MTIPKVNFDIESSRIMGLPPPAEQRMIKILGMVSVGKFSSHFFLPWSFPEGTRVFPPGPGGSPDDLILWYIFIVC